MNKNFSSYGLLNELDQEKTKLEEELLEKERVLTNMLEQKRKEKLEKEAERRSIKLYNNKIVVSIIKDSEKAVGVLALDTVKEELVLFNCKNIVFATGGAGDHGHSGYSIGDLTRKGDIR
mgnify:CR=1 FL=1